MKQIRAWFRAHAGALIGLSAVLGVCLLRFALGLPCPVEHLTGIPCPGFSKIRWERRKRMPQKPGCACC